MLADEKHHTNGSDLSQTCMDLELVQKKSLHTKSLPPAYLFFINYVGKSFTSSLASSLNMPTRVGKGLSSSDHSVEVK